MRDNISVNATEIGTRAVESVVRADVEAETKGKR